MKYFARYNEQGHYNAFYTTKVWKEEDIPTENVVELTKEQYNEAQEVKCGYINGIHSVITISQEQIQENILKALRSNRDRLLSECDWTQIPDSPLTDAQKQAWATYRQALRDLPSTVDINNIVYPEKP